MTMTLLTSREQEIASLASTGLSNKGIARRLELSEGTVKVHLHNIFQKTGVSNRTALVALMQVPTAVTNSVCPWETMHGPLKICNRGPTPRVLTDLPPEFSRKLPS